MMYRPESGESLRRDSRRRSHVSKNVVRLLALVGIGLTTVMLFAFVWSKTDVGKPIVKNKMCSNEAVEEADLVYRKRIVRSSIPSINYRAIQLREVFNDSNYVQLSAARVNGIDPDKLGDPSKSKDLVPIFNTELYAVDTMYHSTPFLVPEAALLLEYVAERFSQLMNEHYASYGRYKIIVTSALRTEHSERRLRRVNRNATDTSCHIYGTTFDISAQRYEHVASGRDTVVDMCKQMLSLALYELRYEGLCYVKYERSSCFHITLRTTQYEGSGESEMCGYVNPGSPEYLSTKAPPRPKARPVSVDNNRQTNSSKYALASSGGGNNNKTKSVNTQEKKQNTKQEHQNKTLPQGITERERLSLEQYERRSY